MIDTNIGGAELLTLVDAGAKWLAHDFERINSLNVFPVPDGDTGTNMKMTIEGGLEAAKEIDTKNIGEFSKKMARAMVLNARGNSGVILSQFFKGLSLGFEGKENVCVHEFAEAMVLATKRSYQVVQKPTEGTILTVMREAGDEALSSFSSDMTLSSYLESYLKSANKSLAHTPELLPVLKEAGVIDSGGAGFILIIEGMLKAANGEKIDEAIEKSERNQGFDATSELTLGYNLEVVLQLQKSKVNLSNFDLDIITNYLKSVGDDILIFKENDNVKLHLHTFDPGLVLTELRKYGEFRCVNLQNRDIDDSFDTSFLEGAKAPLKEHKEFATVTVANGSGLIQAFKEMGVDEVLTGGQTMNTSTKDFIDAFDRINATHIFVYPNNKNIKLAAIQAASEYKKADVHVIPTKTISEGYSAISMLNFEGMTVDDIINEQNEVIENVKTLEVTYSVRDANIDGVNVIKGDYICIYDSHLIASDKNRLEATKKALRAIPDFQDKQVLTVLCGQDVTIDEFDLLQTYAKTLNNYIELYPVEGNQDIYSYIIGVE